MRERKVSETQAAFDRLASQSSEQLRLWRSNPYDRSLYDAEVEFVSRNAPRQGLAVELGCGWDPYYDLMEPGGMLVGLDFSLESLRAGPRLGKGLQLACADANWLPLADSVADVVIATDELICCDGIAPKLMLSEVSRILKPCGRLILEYDNKWCLDSLWMLVDSLIGNKIGYEVTWRQMINLFKSKGGSVTWEVPGSAERLDVRFFSSGEMRRLLAESGFRLLERQAVNVLGGLVPTVVQQRTRSRLLRLLATTLNFLDQWIGRLPGLNHLGGDILVVAEKRSQVKRKLLA